MGQVPREAGLPRRGAVAGRGVRRMTDLGLPPPFAATLAGGQGDCLMIAFSSIGHDPTRMPAPEFQRIAPGRFPGRDLGRPTIFFADQSRSWASAPGWASALRRAVKQARAAVQIRRIVTLGVSMGAVSALRAAEILPVDAVLAIGPQSDLADEPRWSEWTAGRLIPPCPLPQGPWIVLAHGARDDAAQAAGFVPRAGVDHLLFAAQGHSDLAAHLKTHGLQGMVDALATGDRRRLLRIGQAAGATRRQLPR